MMGRCPSSWSQPENPSCQDIMGKFQMVEEILSNFMDQQKRQMDILNNEVASIKLAGPKASMINSSCVTLTETPSKKRSGSKQWGPSRTVPIKNCPLEGNVSKKYWCFDGGR